MKIEEGTSCIIYKFNEYELKQHDAEVRKQVIAELEEWANKKMCWTDDLEGTHTGNGYKMCQKKLQKKLSEMKGERDE